MAAILNFGASLVSLSLLSVATRSAVIKNHCSCKLKVRKSDATAVHKLIRSDCPRFTSMQHCSSNAGSDYNRVKCVLVGDGAVGKTSLVISYTTNGFPTEYVPTAFDNYTVLVTVNKEPIQLQLCDTAGQDDFDQLRPLCYPHTDIFVLCFSIVSPTSFNNITEKWLPEIRRHSQAIPIVLVGTQSDLRNDVKVLIELSQYGERPVSEADGRAMMRRIGAVSYVECSALTQHNMKHVFDVAVMAALVKRSPRVASFRAAERVNPTPSNGVAVTSARPRAASQQPSSATRWWKRPFCCCCA